MTVAIVTGASSGIGEATARLLAREHGAALVLVARREERLRALASELGPHVSFLACDLTSDDAPGRVRAHVEERHGRLDLLVNNAGAALARAVRRRRLGERAPPHGGQLRRGGAPHRGAAAAAAPQRPERDRQRLEHRRARGAPGLGAYSASKFALAGWSDALAGEEAPNGVHVGVVLPGFIPTEGFPQSELVDNRFTRRLVSTPERGAQAIVDAGLGRKHERYVPRPYALAAAARVLVPGLVRRATGGKVGGRLVTRTGGDDQT